MIPRRRSDHGAIAAAARAHPGAVILLHTVKGKGVSFMENRMEWHYLPLSGEQYAAALRELERAVSGDALMRKAFCKLWSSSPRGSPIFS